MRTLLLTMPDTVAERLRSRNCRIAVGRCRGRAPASVVWLAIDAAPRIKISWDERYGLFAGPVPGRAGSAVAVSASVDPASEGARYAFNGSLFGEPVYEPRIARRRFGVRNDSGVPLAFGLLQWAAVNAVALRSPVSFVAVPSDAAADLALVRDLTIWRGTFGGPGIVAAGAGDTALRIPFDCAARLIRCSYDIETDTFSDSDRNDGPTPGDGA